MRAVAGAEVDRAKASGATPLYVSSQTGHLEVATLLLDAAADVDLGLKGARNGCNGCSHCHVMYVEYERLS